MDLRSSKYDKARNLICLRALTAYDKGEDGIEESLAYKDEQQKEKLMVLNDREQYTKAHKAYTALRDAAKNKEDLAVALLIAASGCASCAPDSGDVVYMSHEMRVMWDACNRMHSVAAAVAIDFAETENDTELLRHLFPKKYAKKEQGIPDKHDTQPNQEDNTMSTNNTAAEAITANITIESKTFVNGHDASRLNDAQIIGLIADTEAAIKTLEGIGTKSTKVLDKINGLKAGVVQLAAILDARP